MAIERQTAAALVVATLSRTTCSEYRTETVTWRAASSRSGMLAGANELEEQPSNDAWSIKAHSETMAQQQELAMHYTAVARPSEV